MVSSTLDLLVTSSPTSHPPPVPIPSSSSPASDVARLPRHRQSRMPTVVEEEADADVGLPSPSSSLSSSSSRPPPQVARGFLPTSSTGFSTHAGRGELGCRFGSGGNKGPNRALGWPQKLDSNRTGQPRRVRLAGSTYKIIDRAGRTRDRARRPAKTRFGCRFSEQNHSLSPEPERDRAGAELGLQQKLSTFYFRRRPFLSSVDRILQFCTSGPDHNFDPSTRLAPLPPSS